MTNPRIPRLAALALALPLFVGCKASTADQVETIADEMCACKDSACARSVGDKLKELMKTAEKPSDADKDKVKKAVERMEGCAEKLEG
jgi:hypothetical protein